MDKKHIITLTAAVTGCVALIALCILTGVQNHALAKENEALKAMNHYNNVLAPPPLPDELDFMGEKVPLDDHSVRESLDRELTAICYQHSTTLLCLKRSARYFPVIEQILKEEGLPEDFKYLCVTESSLSNAISPAKAVGFWQFLQSTAQSYGLEVRDEVDERYNVEKATHAACKYLRGSKNRLGSWALAAAAYNMGENGVANSISAQSVQTYWDTYFNPETARYVYRILAYKLVFENPHIYGVQIADHEKYPPIACRVDTITSSVPDWYQYCQKQGITYKQFKEFNPWCRAKKLTVSNGKTYLIQIPTEK